MANIKLIRIDFRLIHGQVVNKWIKITRSNKIVVIDDSLASNEFMRSVYIMAALRGLMFRYTASMMRSKNGKKTSLARVKS